VTTLARGGLLAPETAEAIRAGLAARPLRLPFECFYDEVGSALFDAITRLPEYGLSRAERRLLERSRHAIARELEPPLEVVELGSGSGHTTRPLLEALVRRGSTRYHPVDISPAALAECRRQLAGIPDLVVRPIEGAHVEGLDEAVAQRAARGTLAVLFLGSNIGNFEPPRARELLCEVRARLKPGDFVLLGADLVKPAPVLLAAYDDAAGVTAAFNRNALVHLNRELDADFEPRAFAHRALYDAAARRVEMHLVSRASQSVRVRAFGLELRLAKGDWIWTESSYKFLPGELQRLGRECGFEAAGEWTDSSWAFTLSLMRSV
jgi:dimethylhistidine N-methyltransferase